MIFRSVSLLFLVANATAFVISPASLIQSKRTFLPIKSSLSADPDTETTQENSLIAGDDVEASSTEASPVEASGETESSGDASSVSPAETTASKDEPVNVGQAVRHTIYVGNLPYSSSVQEIRELFSEHAEVRFVNLPKDRETGDLKGFAFVDVGSVDDIPKAVDALNGVTLGGRPLRVSPALEKNQIRSPRKTIEGAKKLYVGNLSFDSSKEDIEEFFSLYSEVKDVFIPVNKFDKPRGFAFISVKEEDEEAVIEATNGIEFMGRILTVNRPEPPGTKRVKRENPGRMKLFVGNLSFYTNGGTLTEVFEEFGEVYDCYIPQDADTNNSRGFGFVSMKREDADAAIGALDGCELDGRIISVNEAKPRGEVTKTPSNDENSEGDELSI